MTTCTYRSALDATARELFDWHAQPAAFERLMPPWDPVRVIARTGTGLDVGNTLTFEAKVGPATVRWEARHVACDPPHGFADEQVRGPFASWRHDHRFADGELTDVVTYEVPLGPLGRGVAGGAVQRRVDAIFGFRHRRTRDDLGWLQPVRGQERPRVAITGATGFVGGQLASLLGVGGYEVVPVSVRDGVAPGALQGARAVVHLAGEPIAGHRWTDAHKERVLRSRIEGTRAVVDRLLAQDPRPEVLVCASAIGWYGDRGDTLVEEEEPPGEGFLAEVCRAWEGATAPAREAGIRVVNVRIGLVLGAQGGMLSTVLPAFRAGAGGPMGSGDQWMSWIAVDDLVGVLHRAIWDPSLSGPVNAVAPEPVRQRDFAHTLGAVLRRPAIVPTPRAALVLALGAQAADELLLASQRVAPAALVAADFPFRYPALEGALRHQLGREA
ncbi:MAG: TIGR01777 family oxidoreductase [Myxococcota bacterium]